jgi:protein TonB
VPPAYPERARRRGIEGQVLVRLWLGAAGEVARAEIVRAEPAGVFERAVLSAVKRWKYRPASAGGGALARGPLEVLLNFELEEGRG